MSKTNTSNIEEMKFFLAKNGLCQCIGCGNFAQVTQYFRDLVTQRICSHRFCYNHAMYDRSYIKGNTYYMTHEIDTNKFE